MTTDEMKARKAAAEAVKVELHTSDPWATDAANTAIDTYLAALSARPAEEMVERAARALYADSPIAMYDERAGLITGAKPWEWLTPEYQDARRADARIALSAALGGDS